MDNRKKWISTRLQSGWIFLLAGMFVAVAGVIIGMEYKSLPYNFRIITGLGILLMGIGAGSIIRYRAALKDDRAALRLAVEETDERTGLIRGRAGNRAYWVSSALIYIGLMWASFAANGGLPELTGDTLWYFLAAGVIIPFGVYVASILIDERKS